MLLWALLAHVHSPMASAIMTDRSVEKIWAVNALPVFSSHSSEESWCRSPPFPDTPPLNQLACEPANHFFLHSSMLSFSIELLTHITRCFPFWFACSHNSPVVFSCLSILLFLTNIVTLLVIISVLSVRSPHILPVHRSRYLWYHCYARYSGEQSHNSDMYWYTSTHLVVLPVCKYVVIQCFRYDHHSLHE